MVINRRYVRIGSISLKERSRFSNYLHGFIVSMISAGMRDKNRTGLYPSIRILMKQNTPAKKI